MFLARRRFINPDDLRFAVNLEYGVNDRTIRTFVCAYLKFLTDSPLLENRRTDREYKHFLAQLTSQPILTIVKRFSALSHAILSNEYAFGAESTLHVWLPEMTKTPIFREYLAWYRSGDPELLRYIISFLTFGKKLEYIDEDFNSTALRGWEKVEELIGGIDFDNHKLVESMRTCMYALIGDLPADPWYPKFGNGHVSERRVVTPSDKLNDLSLDAKLCYAYARGGNYRHELGLGPMMYWASGEVKHAGVSRLAFVPKDVTKSRSICMEPNAYMFFQQELLRKMVQLIDNGLAGRFIRLSDQNLNQKRALLASMTFGSDTIDLSSASDSVSVELVRRIFPPRLLYHMLATRSSQVEKPDGTIVRVNKFAPMGSAVCFPTQCLVFLCTCIVSARMCLDSNFDTWDLSTTSWVAFINEAFHRDAGLNTAYSGRFEPPRIYGDDIICDVRTTDAILNLLVSLGFQPNVSKSFIGSSLVRESCGIYAHNGHDITPCLYRIPHLSGEVDARVYSSIIGAINRFRESGYPGVSGYLLSLLRNTRYKNRIPFVKTRTLFGIFTEHKDFREGDKFYRTHPDYQVGTQYVAVLRSRYHDPASRWVDEYRYTQWWRTKVEGNIPEFSSALSIRSEETRVVAVWSRYE